VSEAEAYLRVRALSAPAALIGTVAVVGLYKLNPVDTQLESAPFQPLNLSSEKLVSKFAFEFNLYRYTVGGYRGLLDTRTPLLVSGGGCTR
jgi:hypothetical protein